MPIARVKMPDGRIARFNVPEGTTPQQAQAVALRHFAAALPKSLAVNGKPMSGLSTTRNQGLTMGFYDELGGVIGAAMDAVASPFSSKVDFNPVASYKAWRDVHRGDVAQTRRDNPTLAPISEFVGGLMSIPVGVPASGARTLAGAVKAGAKVGAKIGAISGFGYGEGLDKSLGGAAGGAAVGGVLGGAIPLGAELIARPLRAARNFISPQSDVGRRLVADALQADGVAPRHVARALQEGNALGVPTMIADLGDNSRSLLASTARKSPKAKAMVRDVILPRQQHQGERIRAAIQSDLGPIANVSQQSEALLKKAKATAGPLYDAAYAQPVADSEELTSLLQTPAGKAALKKAYNIALNERVDPAELGFVLHPSGDVGLAPQTGRFKVVNGLNPYGEVDRQAVETASGRVVGKRGPLDLVGWLRSQGGIKDQGGELRHMGITNAARKMDFVGRETQFGPIVNENGMNLDDAAYRAWENGYFPEMDSRPTVQEFLDAVRGTHEGWGRRFLPEDIAQVENFSNAVDENFRLQNLRSERGANIYDDLSTTAGPRDFAPLSSYGTEKAIQRPTWKTLDYVKRGLDDVVEAYRDPTTRRLNLNTEGRAVNDVRSSFVNELDRLNPDYKAARAAYSGPASANEALRLGNKAINKSAEEIQSITRNMGPDQQAQFALGYRAAMADAMDRRIDGADKVGALLGSPRKREALSAVMGPNANWPRFGQRMAGERAANETYRAVATGSPTAERMAADGLIDDQSLLENAAGRIVRGGRGGITGLMAEGLGFMQDMGRFGAGAAGNRAREDAASLLLQNNPAMLANAMRDAARQSALRRLAERNMLRATQSPAAVTGFTSGALIGGNQ